MRYLVTGGAGFIGSAVAKRLVELGHDVCVIDNMLTGFAKNVPAGAEFLQLDISRAEDLKRLPSGSWDGVMHLAAQSSGEISHERPTLDLFTNSLGTLLLLQWARDLGVERFVHASSMAVYGDVEVQPASEVHPCRPMSFYAITKYAGEGYVRSFSGKGINTTILRLFNVYGPGQNLLNMKQGMISIYLAYLLRRERIIVKGSAERFRDFVYVDDVVDAWIKVLDAPVSFGKTYNVGMGRPTMVREVLAELVAAFGYSPGEYPIEFEGNTPGDQFGIFADTTTIRTDVGWNAQTDLKTGIQQMVRWARGSAE